MLLRLHNVIAGYDGGDVLKGLDLNVEKGSITCVVGPNGAGKSTVLRVISGLLKPRQGEITFDGRSIGGLQPRQVLSMGIVQVPQNHSLFPDIPVREKGREPFGRAAAFSRIRPLPDARSGADPAGRTVDGP
jgi:branched-chain amino acid transport system ATP-binding protein